MDLKKRRWTRPSRSAAIVFLAAIAVTTAGTLGVLIADDGSAPAAPPDATDWAPASASPEVPGLSPVERSEVSADGLVIGRLRLLPTGAVPQGNRGFKLEPDETMRAWNSQAEPLEVQRTSGLTIPESTEWSVTRDGSGYITVAEQPRLVEESVVVEHRASDHPWLLATGPLVEGGLLEEVLSERDEANFTYTYQGVVATVIDNSPAVTADRVWHVKIVIGEHWVSFVAPVLPFEQVRPFINALIDVNR